MGHGSLSVWVTESWVTASDPLPALVWTSPTSANCCYTALWKSKHRKFNIILQWDITKENCVRCIIASSKWTGVIMCLKFTYMGVIQQSVHETKIHDIDDLRKRLLQTCFDFHWNTIWDHVCMMVVDALNTCSDMNVHLYDSPKHFINYQCNLMHVTAIL